jgi:hypothetical protein
VTTWAAGAAGPSRSPSSARKRRSCTR